MKQSEIDNIKHAMMLCQMRLRNLKPHVENSANLSEIYNKVLIEKAILRKKVTDSKNTLLRKFVNKFFLKREKLICDYFN